MSFAITGKKIGTPSPTVPLTSKLQPKAKATSVHSTTTKSKGLTKATGQQNLKQGSIGTQTSKANQGPTSKKGNSDGKVNEKAAVPAGKTTKEDVEKSQKSKIVDKKVEEVGIKEEEKRGKEQKEIEEKREDIWSEVVVRYNHYKQRFPIKNNILSFVPIEEKYSFGDLFKGNFQPVLKQFKSLEVIEPVTMGSALEFSWPVDESIEYRLEIDEDEVEESKFEKKVYKAPKPMFVCSCKKNQRAEEISNQLRQMKPEDFGSAKYKELIEQRDLEDVLFT